MILATAYIAGCRNLRASAPHFSNQRDYKPKQREAGWLGDRCSFCAGTEVLRNHEKVGELDCTVEINVTVCVSSRPLPRRRSSETSVKKSANSTAPFESRSPGTIPAASSVWAIESAGCTADVTGIHQTIVVTIQRIGRIDHGRNDQIVKDAEAVVVTVRHR